MPIQRNEIDQLANFSDLNKLNLQYSSIDDTACALLAYQRTKQTSRKSKVAWEKGNKEPLYEEVRSKKAEIIRGAFLEIYQEYLPLLDVLKSRSIKSVCDIGCGQGINDVFLHKDFQPRLTLVDIEETKDQYHLWAEDGSGYASLDAARALLMENGVDKAMLKTVNPKEAVWKQNGSGFDLVTSLYSCGFHYPVDDYIDLFIDTIDTGGAVCLDLRKKYLQQEGNCLSRLRNAGNEVAIYKDRKSWRILFHK